MYYVQLYEDGVVVDCLTQNRGAAGSSLVGATALCRKARHFILCLVLVKTKKALPDLTEKLKNQIKVTFVAALFEF